MNLSVWAIAVSLIVGSVRTVQLFRLSSKVDVVNAVVLTTLANGRGRELPNVLAGSGSALYLSVARSICEPLDKLLMSDVSEVRPRLQRDTQLALMRANRHLTRFAWLQSVSLAAIALAGVSAVTGDAPSATAGLGLFAATLMWISNVYGTRSIATRMFAGAETLADSLLAGLDQIRAANTDDETPDD